MGRHPCRTSACKAAGREEQPQLSDPHVETENRVRPERWVGRGSVVEETPGPEIPLSACYELCSTSSCSSSWGQ